MATYLELKEIIDRTTSEDQDLYKRTEVAMSHVVDDVLGEGAVVPNHTERLQWAGRALAFPAEEATKMFRAIVLANNGATQTQIRNATDAAIKTNIDAILTEYAIATYQV
jgi:hypothetical protein